LWLDATEPEGFPNVDRAVSLGSGNALMNSYSLKTTQAIADGLRRDFADQQGRRVFTLTRSSFAGQQRTGAALWSGDISSTWDSLRRQVSAALNYQLSGIPYWSEDIGGFFRPHDAHSDPAYHRLLIRWFQYGAFTPIFRVHGSGDGGTELWLVRSRCDPISTHGRGPTLEALCTTTEWCLSLGSSVSRHKMRSLIRPSSFGTLYYRTPIRASRG
jgi:alpha-D-xyloside xylohydrolase